MTQITYYLGLTFFGIIMGLLGIFYRNILKIPNMVLSPLYKVFRKMVKKGGFLKWLAYPLGYCIYCSTFWITAIGYFIKYGVVSFDIVVPLVLSHYVVAYYCKHYSNLSGFKYEKKTTTDWVDSPTNGLADASITDSGFVEPTHTKQYPKDASGLDSMGLSPDEIKAFNNHMDNIKS